MHHAIRRHLLIALLGTAALAGCAGLNTVSGEVSSFGGWPAGRAPGSYSFERLPSQGEAAPFDLLNVHIAPNRQAPSFYQLTEQDRIEVIGHRVTARVPYDPQQSSEEVPDNSPQDAWSYIRLRDGRAGWVLARMIRMAAGRSGSSVTRVMALSPSGEEARRRSFARFRISSSFSKSERPACSRRTLPRRLPRRRTSRRPSAAPPSP